MVADARDPRTTRLSEVMTPAPQALGPDIRAIDALRLMRDGGFRHIPVVQDGRLLGVVSRGDFQASESARIEDETVLWERL